MIVKRYVQETTKDSQLLRHTFLKSVLYLASSDPQPWSSRIAATLHLETLCWTSELQMIKEHAKNTSPICILWRERIRLKH